MVYDEPDKADPKGIKRPVINSDGVYPGRRPMPSVHKRNSQDSQFAVSEGNDPSGMERPATGGPFLRVRNYLKNTAERERSEAAMWSQRARDADAADRQKQLSRPCGCTGGACLCGEDESERRW